MNSFGGNYQGYLSTETFNYGPPPMYELMNQPEIRDQDYYNREFDYPRQQMHQLYHDNDQYGNRGYQSHNYPYVEEQSPFEITQTEYAPEQISVDIRLSNSSYINRELINELGRYDLTCNVRSNHVITVTGFPVRTRSGANEFLTRVRGISGDRRASIVHY